LFEEAVNEETEPRPQVSGELTPKAEVLTS
jgi:hypothetical protein